MYASDSGSWTSDPIPKSASWGARVSILCRASRGTERFSFKLFRLGDLATSLSRAPKLTSPLRQAKLRETSDVQLSGKQLSHCPLWSSTSFSCRSSSLRYLHFKSNKTRATLGVINAFHNSSLYSQSANRSIHIIHPQPPAYHMQNGFYFTGPCSEKITPNHVQFTNRQ